MLRHRRHDYLQVRLELHRHAFCRRRPTDNDRLLNSTSHFIYSIAPAGGYGFDCFGRGAGCIQTFLYAQNRMPHPILRFGAGSEHERERWRLAFKGVLTF